MIAQIMQDNFKKIQPGNDRQIKLSGDELYLFKNTKIPAVLVECGFLSNPDDAAALSDAEYQRKVAYTIYNGIMTYMTSKPDAEDNDTDKNENSDILQETASSV